MEISVYLTAVNDLSEAGNFYRTVIKGIDKNEYKLNFENDGDQIIHLWGITEKSTTTFNKIENNSIILFYNKGLIVGYSKVKQKLNDKELSIKLWGSFIHGVFKEKCHWSNILVLSTFTSLEMSFDEIIKLGKYNSKFSIRRILKLNNEAVNNIKEKHGEIEEFLKLYEPKN